MSNAQSPTIYQIYFDQLQTPYLDPVYLAFNNSCASRPELCEYGVIKELYDNNRHKKSMLTGTVSWKFSQKTHITGHQFINFIRQNPGYDVYFINPYPHLENYQSVWHQGENLGHTEIIQLTQKIFNELNYNIDLRKIRMKAKITSYCNYWVATARFWEQYMAFTLPVYDYILHQCPRDSQHQYLQHAAHKDYAQPYFPFIFERLFSTFLSTNINMRYKKYTYSLAELQKKYGRNKSIYYYILDRLRNGIC